MCNDNLLNKHTELQLNQIKIGSLYRFASIVVDSTRNLFLLSSGTATGSDDERSEKTHRVQPQPRLLGEELQAARPSAGEGYGVPGAASLRRHKHMEPLLKQTSCFR